MIKLICENSEGVKAFNYFPKKSPSDMFDWVLNTLLIFKFLKFVLIQNKLLAKLFL